MLRITVQKKSFQRSRKLQPVSYELARPPETLRELLRMLVEVEVTRYNDEQSLLHFMLEERAVMQLQSVEKHIQIMELAFADGLVKVLQGSRVYMSLDETIDANESCWTFVKLTFLAGG